MVEDKYIGLTLALSGSLAIGTSFIITKKGLNDAGNRSQYENASDNLAYLKNAIWWIGMIVMVIGEIANFAAYTFAPAILVTPLGALSVLIGAVLASLLLKEEMGHIGRLGCTLCLTGSVIIVINAPADKDVQTVDEILYYAVQPGFLLYCFTVLVFSLIMIYGVAPKYGRKNPLVYISICSTVGSISVMAIKGFGIALKLTFAGNNQLTHPSTYVFGIVVAVCIMVQMNYFNKALDIFSTNVVNPMYYVGFSTATLVASLILFQGLNTTDYSKTVSLLCGFVTTYLGVHLLNLSRVPEPPRSAHTALEGGLMYPRLSVSGRMSLDGWNGSANPDGSVPWSAGHDRRTSGSGGRHGVQTIFNAYEDETANGEAHGLHHLRDVPEEDDDDIFPDADDDADERTGLRSSERRGRSPQPNHYHSKPNGPVRSNSGSLAGSNRASPRTSPRPTQ